MKRSLEDALAAFESWLRVERNLSRKTREAYLYDLRRYRDFRLARQQGERLSDVCPEDLSGYIQHLSEDAGQRGAAIARTTSSLRVFFRLCVEERWLDENPALPLETPKQGRKLPVYLVEGELRRLLGAMDPGTPNGLRDRAMVLLMAFGGLRLQEVVGLDLAQLDFDSRTMRVFGKGSKERLLPMNPDLEHALRAWLGVRQAVEKEKAVFTNRFGRRLSGRMVEKIVDKHVFAAGLAKDSLSPHKLRHTFATLLHHKEVDLVEIQTLLGHASITTTQIYTHTNRERLRSAVEGLTPIAGAEGS